MTVETPVLLATCVALIAAITDVRSRRIPNLLTFGATAVALAWHAQHGGIAGVSGSALGWCAGIAIFLPLFLLRGMGGGDIKLMGALGAWLGAPAVLWVALATAIAGGVLALIVSIFHGYVRQAFSNVMHLLGAWAVGGVRPLPELTLEHGTGPRLAYGVAILAGTVATQWGLL